MTEDATSLSRTAQRLVVEARRGYGSPPSYELLWQPVWGAKIDRIEINHGGKPSVAIIWFPELRWEQTFNLLWGDMIRIRTDEPDLAGRTIIFSGFITNFLSDFSGGTDQSKAFERNAILCQDYRWLLSITSPIYGQLARGPDDYANYGTDNQYPINDSYTFLSGRRAIFNADGKPNCDPVLLKLGVYEVPLFADPDIAIPWNARDMLSYVLSPLYNQIYQYLPMPNPYYLPGLDHEDWNKILGHIVVDGLNVVEAAQFICENLGWSFRQDCHNDGTVEFVFYKVAAASGYSRTSSPTIFHKLHAPAVGESVADAVSEGKKILWSMTLAEDIAAVVNNPWGLGAPHRFEFTAELVPAWLDDDLKPDTSDDNNNLFFTEAELQELTEPNEKSFYNYYHPRGSQFRRDVGRKWALNESGRYTIASQWVAGKSYRAGHLVRHGAVTYICIVDHISTLMGQPPNYNYWQQSSGYDRGMPFDFSSIISPEHILNSEGKRLFAPFNRQLLSCLTVDKENLNSVGIKVEFSLDGGETWQIIPAAISSLKEECSIYIEEANLAELVDQAENTISGGDLDDIQLNYWTSLCDDVLNERNFKLNQWYTRVRVTASVQLDQRLRRQAFPTPATGSPFDHSQIYDLSAKYGLTRRTQSSVFANTDLPARQMDSTDWFDTHLNAIRDANQDMSISGRFTLERLWLGDGSGKPDFAVGDCVEKITGREHNLSIAFGGSEIYPEIIQIIYLPDKQKMSLITRDLRFAEVLL